MDMDIDTRPTIAINGTEELLQVVIGTTSGLLFQAGINAPGKTMRFLLPLIDEGLTRLNIPLAHCQGIACTRGPGSFTGIRVVLATIHGLSKAANLPLAGLDYLPLLAKDLMAHWQGEAWVMTWARKDQVYLQGFAMPKGVALIPPQACLLEQAVDLINARTGKILVAGSGLSKNEDFLRHRLTPSVSLATQRDVLCPQALLTASLHADFSHAPITPLYLRASDAQENLPSLARQRGIPLKKALLRIPHQE